MKPSFWIDPHGCSKNDVDAENLVCILEAAGYPRAAGIEDAAMVIVNSCGFIESAKRESIDAVIDLKNAMPGKKIILAGCLAQRYAADIEQALPEADGIFGNGDLAAAPEFFASIEQGERSVATPERVSPLSGRERKYFFSGPASAYLKPTEGCSNHCSYCAIPLIRGELASRPLKDVVEEAVALEARGIREINLVGQDLGSYGKDLSGPGLSELLTALLAATSEARFRVLYIHPDHFPAGLIKLMAAEPRLIAYLDLPFQHASASLLTAMNRHGDAQSYLRLLADIRSALPQIVIRSTFMLGFPGESDDDFLQLLDFIKKADLDWAGFFCYSREDDTPAAALKGRVSKKIVAARLKQAQEVQEAISAAKLERFVGQELELLVEEAIEPAQEGDEELFLCRAYLQAPEVDGLTVLSGSGYQPGDILRARVMKRAGLDLSAIALKLVWRRD